MVLFKKGLKVNVREDLRVNLREDLRVNLREEIIGFRSPYNDALFPKRYNYEHTKF